MKGGAEVTGEAEAATADVREGILDVAERLFAEKGVASTTVRAITAEAGANVAAVNYYFRSKDDLYREVVGRRLGPLNEERARLLADCMKKAGRKGPAVKEVLRALAGPSIRLCFEHPYFARLLSRLRHDPDDSLWPAYRSAQAELTEGFRKAFASAAGPAGGRGAGSPALRARRDPAGLVALPTAGRGDAGGAARELPHLLRRGARRASARQDRLDEEGDRPVKIIE
jgi:AcrR family transcriptional regulator